MEDSDAEEPRAVPPIIHIGPKRTMDEDVECAFYKGGSRFLEFAHAALVSVHDRDELWRRFCILCDISLDLYEQGRFVTGKKELAVSVSEMEEEYYSRLRYGKTSWPIPREQHPSWPEEQLRNKQP